MRICFLSPQIPSPAYGRRGCSILESLAVRGHSITLHCIDDPGPVQGAAQYLKDLRVDVRPVRIPRWRRWGNCLWGYPGSTPLRILHCQSPALLDAFLKDLREGGYDLLHVDRFRMAPYALEARKFFRNPVVLDFPDALSLYYERAVRHPRNRLKAQVDRREWRVIPPYEKDLLLADFRFVACSEVDRARLLEQQPAADIRVLPHQVDLEDFHPKTRGDSQVRGAFTGTLYYLPNIDSLLWLKEEIMPLLADTGLEVDVAGFGATSELDPVKADPSFHFLGYVDRMSDHLWRNDIYLCPLRIGAGVRNKLLEAFAAGMATVSTRLGYEGIDCIPGEHLLAADSAEDFASTVRYLLEHPEERERLGRNARALVERDFSPQAFGDRIEAIYRDDKACG